MPNITVTVGHNLGQDEALKRVKAFVSQQKTQYASMMGNLQESWNGYVGSFSGTGSGMSASVQVTVNPSDVVMDVTLPAIAVFMKGPIETGIREQLTKALA
jgi:hypothetical protein